MPIYKSDKWLDFVDKAQHLAGILEGELVAFEAEDGLEDVRAGLLFRVIRDRVNKHWERLSEVRFLVLMKFRSPLAPSGEACSTTSWNRLIDC